MRLKLTFSIVFISLVCLGQSDWRSMMDDPTANFNEIQSSFYAEFGDSAGGKGTGWKQFKRWEYYHEQRLDENGNFQSADELMQEVKKYRKDHPDFKTYIAGNGNWQLMGPIAKPNNGTGQPNGNGRLTCVAFHPTDANTLYVGAPSGGFWKSTDNGATWTNYITGMTRLGVSSIVVHPSSPNTIFIGTGDRDGGDSPGYGVWKSTDGGITWGPSNTGMGNRTVYEIIMDPSNSNVLIANTNGSRVYRSIDGGATWVFTTLSANSKDLAFHPTNPNIVYASGSRFHRSVDNGVTFTEVSTGLPTPVNRIAIGVSVNQPNWVYLFAGGSTGTGSFEGIYRSTDSGVNFTTRTTTPNIMGYSTTGGDNSDQSWYDMTMAVDPTNANTIYIGAINIWKSIDGGATMSLSAHWTGSGGADDVHADHHAMEFSPHTNNLYNGNDGGLYYTTNGGGVWDELSSGLYIAQVYKIGVSQQTLDKVINGYQDNGTSINVGSTFSTEIGGDGMECIIDPNNDTYMYGALYYGDIRRSTNGGNTFASITGAVGETGAWVTPYKLDPNNSNRMFAGFRNVWRNDAVQTGVAWTQISAFAGTAVMRDIAIAPSNSDVMYVSKTSAAERFFRSNNATTGAPTWTNLTASLPVNSNVNDIEIDPLDPTHLFIAIGNNIYESNDSGGSWTDVSGTLPNISLNTIVIDHDSPVEAMYVGMDVGVYYKDNTMADWSPFSGGIPNIEVLELEIHYNGSECKSMLYAATYGQGLWKSDLKDPGSVSPIACFEASSTEVCAGDVVTLTDFTSYTPTSWTWTITPATYSFTGGTNANSQNPQVLFNAAGMYDIQLKADNATGTDTELKITHITVSGSVLPTAFNYDFEPEPLCGTASNCATTLCPLVSTLWTNLTSGVEDDIDWRVDEGGTPSANTGPSVDFNPGTAIGNYAYIEASSCSGRFAILQSTCINLDKDYTFQLGYHMFGSSTGELHVDISTGGVWINDIMPALIGDQGNAWQVATVDLSLYTGQVVKIRIRGYTGGGFASDIAIDDIEFIHISGLPVSLISFEAEAKERSVDLTWKTNTENNVSHFEVERSSNAADWETILEKQAVGNSLVPVDYLVEDVSPLDGYGYYRLRMVDLDGSVAYSDTRSVLFGEGNVKLYPNPAQGYIILEHSNIAKNNIQLINLMGQRIAIDPKHFGVSSVHIPIEGLPDGLYFIKSVDTNGKEYMVKFSVKR